MAFVVSSKPAPASADAVLCSLFDGHHRSLIRLARLLLDDHGAAEEVVQDAYVASLPKLAKLAEPEAALSYVRSAVLNGARSRMRRRQVALRHPGIYLLGTAASPEDQAVAGADHRAVLEAVRALPGRQRDCVILRYWLDLSEAEIALTLRISRGSVKTHLHRGMARLETRLEDMR